LDDSYEVYVNRVARMTLPEAYRSQVQHIQASPKYHQLPDGGFQPAPFPGYSVITPPWTDEINNDEFYRRLEALQQQLVQHLPANLLIPVPPESFHLTVADLIWDSAYHHANEDPAFEPQLRDRIAESFQKCQSLVQGGDRVVWQALGLIIRTRAVGVCLVPRNEDSYDRVLQVRRAIYQNSALMALGIEQQYHFTAHVTLGYFGAVSAETDRDRIGETLIEVNQTLLDPDSPQELWVHRAELRKFDDMTRYYRSPDWSTLAL
jgi:hypothetical protein